MCSRSVARGRDFYTRYGKRLTAEFTRRAITPSLESIRPMAQIAISDFIDGEVDAVYVAYTQVHQYACIQTPEIQQIAADRRRLKASGDITDFIFEPSPAAVLEALAPSLSWRCRSIRRCWNRSRAEHSSRMVAMRNATDNAQDLVRDLTLSYNKVRQAQITREVSEIAAGAAAMS